MKKRNWKRIVWPIIGILWAIVFLAIGLPWLSALLVIAFIVYLIFSKKKPSTPKKAPQDAAELTFPVFVVKGSSRYHMSATCPAIATTKNWSTIPYNKAKKKGLQPCGRCSK